MGSGWGILNCVCHRA